MSATESPWAGISQHIEAATGERFAVKRQYSIGGGCVNAAYRVEGEHNSYFVKTNQIDKAFMFEAEAAGLAELAGTGAVRVPIPVCSGGTGSTAFLVLEYIPLVQGGHASQCELGRQLAVMHQFEHGQFGWKQDNTIGTTLQDNTRTDSWIDFWRDSRLGVQVALAARHGAPDKLLRKAAQLMSGLAVFFPDAQPKPSLLHGDLWGANWAADQQGHPVVFDPAVYYGDRETDLAMTELFGGFSSGFYAAYHEAYPLDTGYATRKILYNIYHVLNHFNLFGGGYALQAERMIDTLLSETGG